MKKNFIILVKNLEHDRTGCTTIVTRGHQGRILEPKGDIMQHSCEHCGTRYEIPNQKIQGRRVKVRCQNCENAMLVVGPGAEEADQGAAVPRSGIYYYAHQGQPVGPVGPYSLREQAREGIIGARSYVWNPSFDGWQRVIESEDLRWLYEIVLDTQLAQQQQLKDAFDQAALLSDGRGYFPDPTLKSGVILLDQNAQRQLENLAEVRGLMPALPEQQEHSAWRYAPAALAASLLLGMAMGTAAFMLGWGEHIPALSSLLGQGLQTVASL